MAERELAGTVDLCDGRGHLNPHARGWSRVPLHRANLRGAYGRKKRWDYWLVTGDDVYVSVTYADVDYLGTASVWIYEPSSGVETEIAKLVPLGRGFHLPDLPCTGTMVYDGGGLRLAIEESDDATRLSATGSAGSVPIEVDIVVEKPAGHESLNVVIPWSDRRFQFTSKQNTRPARGTVRVGDRSYDLGGAGPAYGTLDLGRGVWPYSVRWNWAAASGTSRDGRTVGLQLGGKWTVGTGYTENGLCIDGRLTKIDSELEWSYDWENPLRTWRVRDVVGGLIEAELTPTKDRHTRTNVGIVSMEVHQCFGTWAGRIMTADGDEVEFEGMLGFAEEARNRW